MLGAGYGGALGALAVLARCGTLAAGEDAPPAPAAPAVRVHFLTRDDAPTRRLAQEQVRAFHLESPTAEVRVDHAADWLETFRSLVASGSAIDALSHSHEATGAAVRAGLLQNLEPYLARQRDFREGDFERGGWHAAQYEGKRWGLPWEGGAYALVFNTDLFQASGVPLPDPKKRMTWDDLLGVARRLTVDGAGRRPADPGFDPHSTQVYGFAANTSWGLAGFIMSGGGEMLTAEGKVPVDSPEAVEALQLFADLQARHFVAPDATAPARFEQGQVAMVYQGAWCLPRYNAAGIRWGAAPAPMRRVAVSGAHFSPLVMSRGAADKDATWAWLWFAALSESGQRLAVDAGQTQPVRRSLEARFVEAETPPAAPYRQVFADELKGGTLRVAGDRTGSYWGGHKREWARLWQHLLLPVLRGEQGALPVAGRLRRHTEFLLKLGRSPISPPGALDLASGPDSGTP
jgi:multiple sugar transport system substrate-binding protein